MKRELYRSINNTFSNNDKLIEDLKYRLSNNKKLLKRYEGKYALNKDGDLVYLPANIVIIPSNEKEEFIKQKMENNLNIVGHGINAIYKFLCRDYGNITRKDVSTYLKSNKQHALIQNPKLLKAKPITANKPNVIFQIDLIDMMYLEKQNKHYKYILNCVDIYSRYSFLRLLKNKESQTILEAVKDIIEESGKPKIIQTDQGSEFKTPFNEFLRDNEIKQIFNHSYSPNQNTYVERSNQEVRKLINTALTIRNSKTYIDILDEIEKAKNATYNKNLKCSPRDLYTDKPNNEFVDEVKERNEKKMKKYKESDNFEVNDKVLVRMSCIFSDMRRMIKQKETKKCPIIFMPQIFTILRVIKSRKPNTRNKYVLQNPDTETVISTPVPTKTRYFTSNDIIKTDLTDYDFDININEAIDLNHIERTRNDLIYE